MNSDFPVTGTAALLELLTPFVPDDFINDCWPHGPTGSTLALTNVQPTDSALYSVTIRNALGAVSSAPAALNVALLPSPPLVETFTRLAGGEFYFQFSAEPGHTYWLESSTNFLNWVTVTNLVNDTGNAEVLILPDPSQSQQYFRVMWKP